MSQTISFEEQDLYYGSANNIVYLKQLEGIVHPFKQSEIFSAPSLESKQLALQYSLPLSFLGKEYSHTVIPCVPAHSLYSKIQGVNLHNNEVEVEYKKGKSTELPPLDLLLNKCFVKVEKNDQELDFCAFQSGKRSAIVKTQDKQYLRLKGCGNLDQGFPLEKATSKYKEQVFEIRGCQFEHTAKRELYISNEIEQKTDVIPGIVPLCYYEYSSSSVDKGMKNDGPAIRKYCSVYKTTGEKRLQTHLLQGLEGVLRQCLNIVKREGSIFEFLIEQFRQCPINRVVLNNTNDTIVEIDSNLMDLLEVEQRNDISQIGGVFTIDKINKCLDLISKNKQYHQCNTSSSPEDKNPQINETENNSSEAENKDEEQLKKLSQEKQSVIDFSKGQEFLKHSDKYTYLLNIIGAKIGKIQFEYLFSKLADIYARLGWEVGITMRQFYKHRLNWGYYSDHDTSYHCNAHPNNFIVEQQNNKRLLSPLDFDMAFFQKEFINIEDSNTFGENDEVLFNHFMELGRQSLELAISGLEIMSNFTFSTQQQQDQSLEQSLLFQVHLQALKDTMRVHYMKAFEGMESSAENIDLSQDNNIIHNIIKVALILTCDETC